MELLVGDGLENMTPEQAADRAEALSKADDGKPGESLGETATAELMATHNDLQARLKKKPDDPAMSARLEAIGAELKKRGKMEKAAKEQPSAATSLSPEKARQMLHEGKASGKPITDQQRKFFGAVGGHLPSPGSKVKKSGLETLDEYLEKAKYTKRTGTPGNYQYEYAGGPTLTSKEGGGEKPAPKEQSSASASLVSSVKSLKEVITGGKQPSPQDVRSMGIAAAAAARENPDQIDMIKRVALGLKAKLDPKGAKDINKLVKELDKTARNVNRGMVYNKLKGWVKKSMSNIETLDEYLEKAGPYIGKRGGKWADPQHKIPWKEAKHAGKKEPQAKAVDEDMAEELELYIMNDETLYRQMYIPAVTNLVNKMASGKYDHAQASKLFNYLATEGAKRYLKEHGSPGATVDPATRMAAARSIAADFHDEAKLGNWDDYLNKKNKKAVGTLAKKSMSGLETLDEYLGKAKYTKRTGTPGNYRYEYGPKKGKAPKQADAGKDKEALSPFAAGGAREKVLAEGVAKVLKKLGVKLDNPIRIDTRGNLNVWAREAVTKFVHDATGQYSQGGWYKHFTWEAALRKESEDASQKLDDIERRRQLWVNRPEYKALFKKSLDESSVLSNYPTGQTGTEKTMSGLDNLKDYLAKADPTAVGPKADDSGLPRNYYSGAGGDATQSEGSLGPTPMDAHKDGTGGGRGSHTGDKGGGPAPMGDDSGLPRKHYEGGSEGDATQTSGSVGPTPMDGQTIPGGKTNYYAAGPEDGGPLAAVGETTGSKDSSPGPGQDRQGQVTGTSTATQVLSEDDRVSAYLSKTGGGYRKSMTPAGQLEEVAQQRAQAEANLRKGEADVQIPVPPHPYQETAFGNIEDRTEALLKSEFYTGQSPAEGRPSAVIDRTILCKGEGCHTHYAAMLTACPGCGAGQTVSRVLPNSGFSGGGNNGVRLEKSRQAFLRPAKKDADIVIR